MFARRSFEPPESLAYAPFLNLPNVSRIYLDEPPELGSEPFAWGLMQLIVGPADGAQKKAQQLVRAAASNPAEQATLVELVETTLVYKFPELGREEIAKMLGMATEASQTRVFQEGWAEGEQTLILKQLERKVGAISPELVTRIVSLPINSLEALGEALLDFETVEDLLNWLQTSS